jgi:hypothetical protein
VESSAHIEDDTWAEEEFGVADLGDVRRTRRLIQIARALGAQPSASLPQAMQNGAALKAAYRFFDNPNADEQAMLVSHLQSTCQRIKQVPRVLAVQDTCYLNWSHHPSTQGLGALSKKEQQGLLLHSTLAITPERVPLGVLQEQIWARNTETFAQLEDHKQRPIEEKESNKWLLSLESVIATQKLIPGTHFVSMGDREADVYDLFLVSRPVGVDLLVRASGDRRVENDEAHYLWAALAATPEAASLELYVPKTNKRPAHIASVAVHWKAIQLHPPKHRATEKLASVSVWAVWVIEPHPPEGAEAVEWMLLTTVPVHTIADALERVEWYTCRWEIEIWHKVLKSGCKIEERQLDDAANLKRLLPIFSVIAWRILYATMLARALPDVECTILFEADEWQALYCAIHEVALPPSEPPSLREAVRMTARLGGFLGRKGDGEPGVTTLWKGLQRLNDLTRMYKILRPCTHPA